MNTISDIIKHKACIGCGLCQAVDIKKRVSMQIEADGFYYPTGALVKDDDKLIRKICPGKNVRLDEYGGLWGVVKETYDGWALDSEVRNNGSSGGVLSAICIELLERKEITAVLHVGSDEENPKLNSLHISRTREDVLKRCSSRYAPADVFSRIKNFLELDEVYAFVGKPCDITAMQAFLETHPQYQSKVKIYLSFFCAGIPSYRGTDALLEKNKKLTSLKYRGNGWPGYFTAKYSDGSETKMSYLESWGNVLGRYVNFRCKICPDGIGLAADIVAADSWKTKDGYPDFKEQDGRNFIIVRTDLGKKILQQCVENETIHVEPLNINSINSKQPYQHNRRRTLGWRIAGVQIASLGFFRFEKIGVFRNMKHINVFKGVKICLGTIKRYFSK